MALRAAPKRKVDLQKLDDLQKEIFGSEPVEPTPVVKSEERISTKESAPIKVGTTKSAKEKVSDGKKQTKIPTEANDSNNTPSNQSNEVKVNSATFVPKISAGTELSDMETIAARITSSKAGQGRNTTRPFSIPRTLIIDTTRLKAKFRTIDEQFTQNVIIDFLLREALAAATPENYKDLRTTAFEFIKRPDESTRRSLTVTEEVVYQMSELKAGINLETGKKYSNDEIFSTLLAIGVSWLYRNNILS